MKFKAKFLQPKSAYVSGQGLSSPQDHDPHCSGCSRCNGQPPSEGRLYSQKVMWVEDK